MSGIRRFRNGHYVSAAYNPCQGRLVRRDAVTIGDCLQRAAGGQPALFNRTIGHYRNTAPNECGQKIELGTTSSDVVQDLISRAVRAASRRQLVHIRKVQVADAPSTDFARSFQPFHAADYLGEGNRAAPVQEVKVQPVGSQALKASFARPLQPAAAGILRVGLADEDDLIANPDESLANKGLGCAIAIHLGRVDHGQAEIDAGP